MCAAEKKRMEKKPMEKKRIDPHFRERRERIATAVLAHLVGNVGKFEPDQVETALRAADALMDMMDVEVE